MADLTARWHAALAELPEEHWQALTAASGLPFYSWRWLTALESSGSVAPREGWQPLHLALWRGERPVAVAPLYLKGHSYGEFVFDQSFAQLAGQLGFFLLLTLHVFHILILVLILLCQAGTVDSS